MSARPNPEKTEAKRRKVTTMTIQAMKRRGEPITMVTAYDFPSARAAEAAEMDVVLVGDSVAMVVLGHESTLAVTMDEMLHHARAVRRGASTPLLVGDLPFMSYQASVAEAVRNAGRYLQEAGMDAVKLEGGQPVAETVGAIVTAGIPVMGHVGLTPQSVNTLGGYRVQGKSCDSARQLVRDALALERAGCFAVVLEGVPARLAGFISDRLSIPTIGIGAGPAVGGQVLVFHDLVGWYDDLAPRFVKRYDALGARATDALRSFRREVRERAFPGPEHSYSMADEEWAAFVASEGRQGERGDLPGLAVEVVDA
jgi:3-methyl-2-oxobutanoate hydroxymethyltransferase